jgi:L-amino acid N-acyltransferase YncA
MVNYADIRKYMAEARDLYNQHVIDTTASFHTEALTAGEFAGIAAQDGDPYESYAVLADKRFAGYVLFCPFNPRQAYKRTAEVTIYMKKEYHGTGMAMDAIGFIEMRAAQKGIKTMLAKITAENIPSIRFFQKAGYRQAGILRDVGEKFGRILSVAIYQKDIPGK